MKKRIEFKAQIEFTGDVDQFEKICEAIETLPVRIRATPSGAAGVHGMAEEQGNGDPTGVWTIGPSLLLEKEVLGRLTQGMQRFHISSKICGGVQQPHLHLDDEIVLLDRSRFQELVGMTARKLAERLPEKLNYTQTVEKVNMMYTLKD